MTLTSDDAAWIELGWRDAWQHEERDAHGRWTHGASLPVSHGGEQRGWKGQFAGRDSFVPDLKPALDHKTLTSAGRPDGTGTAEDPIDVRGDLDRAIRLMADGKHVRLNQVSEISTLVSKINDLVKDTPRDKQPKWDLGMISVKGTNLFTEQTEGIPRVKMPQLSGPAQPGSKAAEIAGGAGKFVDLGSQFRDFLKSRGVDVKYEMVPASHLRATQTQLTATTVAGIAQEAMHGNASVLKMLAEPLWVSRDNYVIDGHHRWAANMVMDALDGQLGNASPIEVQRVNMDIGAIIPAANQYAQDMGIAGVDIGNAKLVNTANDTLSGQLLDFAFNPAEPRDSFGRWTRFGGVGTAADTMMKNREGFSVSVRTGGEPAHGFMVAQTDHTHTYPASILDDHQQLTRAIDTMLTQEKSAFASGDTYLGGWVHDGKLWLEPSDNIADREHAVQEGTSRNQIAIWDVDHGQEIDTGGSGGGRIYEHANPEGDHWASTGELRGAARERTAGDRSGAGGPHSGGTLTGQLIDLGWRTELRDRHGRWTRGGSVAESGTDLRNRILAEMQHPADAVSNQYLRSAARVLETAESGTNWRTYAAAYVENAATEIEKRGEDADRAKSLRGLAHEIRMAPDDAVQSGTALAAVRQEVRKAAQIVPSLIGGGAHENAFNGKVQIFTSDPNVSLLGELKWDGTMRLREDVAKSVQNDHDHPDAAIQDPAAHAVVLHELIHGVTPTGTQQRDMRAYQDYSTAQIEEGFTELGTIHHAPEYFDKMGIGSRETAILSDQENELDAYGWETRHATMSEYARRLQDPMRIAHGDAWGHYGQQTKDAQDWVQEIAKEEGYGDLRPGQPGHTRVMQLADEINREGAAGKIGVMARQMALATVKDAAMRDNLDFMSTLTASIETSIRQSWAAGTPGEAGKAAARTARRAASQRLAEMGLRAA